MKISLNISDSAYKALINGGDRRMRGSIGMISPTEADFTAYNIGKGEPRKYMKLPHGRVSLSPKQARLTLSFDLDEEIDQFDALRGSARQGGQFQIMCLSFDPENDYGQDRVGTQSVTENVRIRFNWNASTTTLKGQRYFSRVLTDGPISRINFCTIPEREIGAEMPVYGEYDAQFEERLRPYIENLTKATGQIRCKEAERLIRKLKEECAEFARKSQSRVYENLSFRALVIAYLKACVLYVANGQKWERSMDAFIRWSLNYDLWVKMYFFGSAIHAAEMEGREHIGRRGPRNMLTLLPETFNRQQVVAVRQSQGLSEDGTTGMLRTWMNRRYIEQTADNEWRKIQ